jgi:hypothetical protein
VALGLVGPVDAVFEGQRAEFTLTLSEASKLPQRVTITTAPGSATYGVDYFAPLKQSILFSPGQVSQKFSIATLRDARSDRVEGMETFTVIATPDNRALKTRSHVVKINDTTGSSPSGGTSNFQITFTHDSSVTANIRKTLEQAAARWSKVIVGDLPDVIYAGRTIDDLEIAVTVASASSLPTGVIAAASYDQRRPGPAGLPYLGSIEISDAFVNARGIMNTLTHEIGHALGFGNLWQNEARFKPLVTGIGTGNPIFVGANAVREYNTLFGTSGTSVPLYEQSTVQPATYDGSYGSHWRDSVFNASGGTSFELMTSRYNVNGMVNGGAVPAILSRVTVGAMQDLGYVVNYANAEAYVKPATSANPRAPAGGSFGGSAAGQGRAWSRAFATLATGDGPGTASQPVNYPSTSRVGAHGGLVAAEPLPSHYRNDADTSHPQIAKPSAVRTQRLNLTVRRGVDATHPSPVVVVTAPVTQQPILS